MKRIQSILTGQHEIPSAVKRAKYVGIHVYLKHRGNTITQTCVFIHFTSFCIIVITTDCMSYEQSVRKVVGGFGKKSCVSNAVRKQGNTCASPTAMI